MRNVWEREVAKDASYLLGDFNKYKKFLNDDSFKKTIIETEDLLKRVINNEHLPIEYLIDKSENNYIISYRVFCNIAGSEKYKKISSSLLDEDGNLFYAVKKTLIFDKNLKEFYIITEQINPRNFDLNCPSFGYFQDEIIEKYTNKNGKEPMIKCKAFGKLMNKISDFDTRENDFVKSLKIKLGEI